MKTIIALSGSFNPITKAHYEIMSDAVDKFHADEGLFILTNNAYLTRKSLLKVAVPSNFILSEAKRAEMVNSLQKENPKLSCWGCELGGASPSTYRTLNKLYKDISKKYPKDTIKLYFAIGDDKLPQLSHWTDIDKLIAFCDIIVYARKLNIASVISSDPFLSAHASQIHSLTTSAGTETISSTELRRRFFAGQNYKSLMNDGPYRLMSQMSPSDFKPITPEDILEATILYDGRFGESSARVKVFRYNNELFSKWPTASLGNQSDRRSGVVYDKEFTVKVPANATPTVTGCENADCVDVAERLLSEGLHPAILNMASRKTPCGDYQKGGNGQEESLCQVSTLSQSLFQFGNPKLKCVKAVGVTVDSGVYPMDINYGGIYSPSVLFFRQNISGYFALRNHPFECPVISVASLSNRQKAGETNAEGIYFQNDGTLTIQGKEIETNKIRTIFRIALEKGHDSLVLGAFGCDSSNLLPSEVAELFANVLNETEFKNRFKKLVFAIYEGVPSPRKAPMGKGGKFAPFYQMFG